MQHNVHMYGLLGDDDDDAGDGFPVFLFLLFMMHERLSAKARAANALTHSMCKRTQYGRRGRQQIPNLNGNVESSAQTSDMRVVLHGWRTRRI